jgi:hypothetical protein
LNEQGDVPALPEWRFRNRRRIGDWVIAQEARIEADKLLGRQGFCARRVGDRVDEAKVDPRRAAGIGETDVGRGDRGRAEHERGDA